jgi:hypothetical protein
VDHDKVNRWLALASSLAIIAGILFLAFELKQNNDLLRAQVRLERANVRIDAYSQQLTNPALLQATLKSRNGETLNAAEQELLVYLSMQIFTRWEYVIGEYNEGLLTQDSVPIEDWRRVVNENPHMKVTWDRRGHESFRPGFVQFMEEFVLSK